MKIVTCIIQNAKFWIDEFERYAQPVYISQDVDFYITLFTKLEKELIEFKKSHKKIAFVEENHICYMNEVKTEKTVSMLIEKCSYFKQNVSVIISDKVNALTQG